MIDNVKLSCMTQLGKLLIGICLFGYGTTIIAQTTILASGSNASGPGGKVSYSVGQIADNRNTGTNGSVSQGVQQPYEISVITGFEETKDISLKLVVYPNPATDFIKLDIMESELQNLRYQLYDINGSLLIEKDIKDNETSISMQNCLPSTYILKVVQGNKEIKSFKIIKH